MSLSKNIGLCLDVSFLLVYVLWIVCVGNFLLHTPLVEIPKRQQDIALLSGWFLCHVYHAAVLYRDNKIVEMRNILRSWRLKLRDCVRQSFIATILKNIVDALLLRRICISINAVFGYFIVGCTCWFALAATVQTFLEKDQDFYLQNFMFSILYQTAIRIGDFKGLGKLVTDLTYICIHGGCLGEYLGYRGSYIASVSGTVLLVWYALWKFVDCPSNDSPSGGRQSGGHSPDDNTPGGGGGPGPSRGNPPHDRPSGDGGPGPSRGNPPHDRPSGGGGPGPSHDRPSGGGPQDKAGQSRKASQWKPKQKGKKYR